MRRTNRLFLACTGLFLLLTLFLVPVEGDDGLRQGRSWTWQISADQQVPWSEMWAPLFLAVMFAWHAWEILAERKRA
jgi:hypothetical protein